MKNYQLVPPMLNLAGLYLKTRSKKANQKKEDSTKYFLSTRIKRNKGPLLLSIRLQGNLNVKKSSNKNIRICLNISRILEYQT